MVHPDWSGEWAGTVVPEGGANHPEVQRRERQRIRNHRRRVQIMRRAAGAVALALLVVVALTLGSDLLSVRG